ncbi:MAG: hypothetical protein GY874_21380 [Desulfobacteraceae bacterium]|nr:hypothetical protein [Desulfobacteraceae bacterium]
MNDTPLIIAHRGAKDEAPENTYSAFERALKYPINGIELDVQMSRDGHLVIYHDWTIYRLTQQRRYLFNMNQHELAEIDWGAWFHKDFSGEPLPTLEAVLTRLGPRTRWMIEIKSHPAQRASGRIRHLTEKVLNLLERQHHIIKPDQIHILSFDPKVLLHASGIATQWRYVLNLSKKMPDQKFLQNLSCLKYLWAVNDKIGKLSVELVQKAHKAGLKVLTYTCNNPGQVRKALNLGADAILTDRPGWLSRYLQRI